MRNDEVGSQGENTGTAGTAVPPATKSPFEGFRYSIETTSPPRMVAFFPSVREPGTDTV